MTDLALSAISASRGSPSDRVASSGTSRYGLVDCIREHVVEKDGHLAPAPIQGQHQQGQTLPVSIALSKVFTSYNYGATWQSYGFTLTNLVNFGVNNFYALMTLL